MPAHELGHEGFASSKTQPFSRLPAEKLTIAPENSHADQCGCCRSDGSASIAAHTSPKHLGFHRCLFRMNPLTPLLPDNKDGGANGRALAH
ncbi:hypothetical protein SKAU_G00291960 [Synaphobranchus kaupii]|uniref:Uncharacterized protein n=1 Tax=Synaphobranchus kaupii TaxID=118154 RepID=A0A9Q1ETZ6_SYNKA|nr:hypothetical protein SKAU_G00291960 [Synaphobranchus kaupii]